ncbi:MAG TPA: protein kinase [Gemmataceae bacterium]|nr:protein kinase [Gemmataceae bacterium]
MPLVIRCPHCQKPMQLADNSAGKQFRCPSCHNPFTVGGGNQPAAVGAAAAAGGGGAAVATRPAAPPAPAPAHPPSTPSAPTVDGGSAKTAPAPSTPSECPACKAALLPGAIACMDCGYMIQPETTAAELEGAPNICPNPACGVANPPSERNCQRCGTVLPTAPGTMLHGRYKIERLLAMGGFGAVYLASDTKNGNRPVAIKDMICADPQEFAIRLNFFRREAEILRSLESIPIVPRVYDLIEQGQSAHLVLEFIRGQDLLKLMEGNNNKPFTLEQVIEWSVSICDVLQHMHTQSPPLVHRDLKPDNIMLLEDHRAIKMIDFGTARDLGRTVKEKMAAKTRVYTEGYAPPEQIVGKPEARSDLFALAGTMYHLATGKAPEGFYTARELETQLSEANSSIPANERWFYELIKINLSEDVNDRYFSAREIKADLQRQQVTKEIPCPKCQQVNKVREPYCSKCAEAMTDPTPPCYHCGKPNRMGSRCCIHCGNRLR